MLQRSFGVPRLAAATLPMAAAILGLTQAAAFAATNVGGNITTNSTWTLAGSPYLAQSTVGIPAGVTLTIEPGVVVKFVGTFRQMVVYEGGTLNAIGTAESRIVFTSIQDDSIAGDSGGDGPTTGAPGQWYHIGVMGTATLHYVDVRYGGYGSSNENYGAVAVHSGGVADLDHCALYLNQRSGIKVSLNSSATLAHTVSTQNAVGASGYNAALTIRANSSLSANSHTGLFLNVGTTYTGPPALVMNSDVANNGEFGIRVINGTSVPAGSEPFGHQNNIFNNKAGAAGRQLLLVWPLVQSDWTNNYWGPVVDPIPCSWAPPTTSGSHLSPTIQLTYCVDPPEGPTSSTVYAIPGCPNDKQMRCRSDWVTNVPYSANRIDNSGQ